jgi:hypothetical protein
MIFTLIYWYINKNMFPQFVKTGDFPRFIIEEKIVGITRFEKNGIRTVKSQCFRMFLSENKKYLYVAITKNHCITIAVEDDVVNMTLSGVKNASHTMTNFSDFEHSPLLYLVLFIYNLYVDKYTNLMWYLRKVLANKPFTTHAVFYDEPFEMVAPTNRYALNECCKMYNKAMNSDSIFPREMLDSKPWEIVNLEGLKAYSKYVKICNNANNANRMLVAEGNVNSNFIDIYNDNLYILFEYAIEYNRVDIATMLYLNYTLGKRTLLKIVKEWPYNDVVEFVYSIN